MLSQTSVRPKSFCKIWLRKCVHNTLMLVLVGVGLQEQLADIAATQVRDARLVPGYSAEVRRALGILPRSAPTRLLCFAHKAAHWFCPHRPPIHKLAAWSSLPTQMLRQLHPQRLQDCNLQICLLTNWIQIGF